MSNSPQEAFVHSISPHILGSQRLFFPAVYGRHGNEPADVAWVANRCAVLMHMEDGKRKYEHKRDKNLRQLAGWLRMWKSGQPLCGEINGDKFAIGFGEIDHVVGLSVVGGADSVCEFHTDRVIDLSAYNVSACATITVPILMRLADIVAGPRDLIAIMDLIRVGFNKYAFEADLLDAMSIQLNQIVSATMAEMPVNPGGSIGIVEIVDRMLAIFRATKMAASNDVIIPDLTVADLIWFSLAWKYLHDEVGGPGVAGREIGIVSHRSGIYTHKCVTAATSTSLLKYMNVLLDDPSPGISLDTVYDIAKGAPIRFLDIAKRIGPSMLEMELLELRQVIQSSTNSHCA